MHGQLGFMAMQRAALTHLPRIIRSCRRGQVLLGTVNEDALVPFVSQQASHICIVAMHCTQHQPAPAVDIAAPAPAVLQLPDLTAQVDQASLTHPPHLTLHGLQLQNLDLAMALAKRGNLPGAEGLVVQQFQQLYAAGQYKEAAELAADSPQVRWVVFHCCCHTAICRWHAATPKDWGG